MSGNLSLNAESLYGDLLRALQPRWQAQDRLVGITSGGAWLAERLQADLGVAEPFGVISSAMHRDDFARRGLADGGVTRLPFDIEGACLWVIDDVLYTGRTVRAVINELYDYGRPARVRLAVLVDRGGRELPIQSDCAAARLSLPADQKLRLQRNDQGQLSFSLRG
ncbi:MAG: bifunctional pyr operon transcriptional regulator/uracil phosphoribosyltransferase PyrR [Betaproteobacteria bacterium]|nr:bifunctional pyr operon transcriptional regulator/uracil phosphoribosyltransferase PyrR [Betaproteobacteria bacterium]NBY06226.1 bifunctional pyr operon transcriptional regulator/uracil phosphoribosyltransferase PyrR [Betaproteobacteria bacterium]